jgi:hypothetical protein
MDEMQVIDINYNRKFGVEIELNAFDGRDFKKNPLLKGELPKGIDYIARLLVEILDKQVRVCGWHPTHNNEDWVCKPDSSCGIEICSPATKGRATLLEIEKVIKAIGEDRNIKIDNRCSLHVHVDISDCLYRSANSSRYDWAQSPRSLAAILACWIKCEAVFLDSVPCDRKRNRYCPSIGMSDLFTHNSNIDPIELILSLGQNKYSTINTFHLLNGKRDTIEFRIMDNEGCISSNITKNWINLILHFVEVAKNQNLPKKYIKGDVWSSLLWLDPREVIEFLFNGNLSLDLVEVRDWFLTRLLCNIKTDLPGVWSNAGRSFAIQQVEEMTKEMKLN